MRTMVSMAVAVALAGTLGACGGTGRPAPAPTPPHKVPTATPTPTSTAATTTPTTAPAATVTKDPCRLMTRQEASALTGISFGPGRREHDADGEQRCIYGYQTKNVFIVAVTQGTSVAQAKSEAGKLRAEAQHAFDVPVSLSTASGVGDDAELLRSSLGTNGVTVHIAGLYVRKGRIGLGLVDAAVTGHTPSTAALLAQGRTAVSRLP